MPRERQERSSMEAFPRFDLDGRTALVTGAGRGLGRAISLAMAHAGADVVLGLRDPAAAGGLAEEIKGLGRRALPVAMDVRDLAQVREAVARTVADFGRLDILVNNAGLGPANPAESVYCLSKAAISHLTKCLAIEWGRYGITVNAVAPTFIRTPGTEADLADPEFRADVVERIAGLHRIGEPVDVTGAVVFLASPAAGLITGTTLLVDGGWTAR